MARQTSTSSLRQATNQAAATAGTDKTGPDIFDLIKKMRPEVEKALPPSVTAERLIRLTLTEVRNTPKLQECTSQSILGALMQAAQLGLEPGPLGLAYLVPYWSKKLGSFECQLIIGYRGLVDLARRGGATISAHAVHEHDEFEVAYGLDETLVHRPNLRGDRGPVWAYYAVGIHRDGGRQFEVMTRAEAESHRDRFGNTSNGSPWLTDFDAMALKTCARQLAKWMPLSVEARDAIAGDGGTFRFDGGAVELVTAPIDVIDTTADEPTPADGQADTDQDGGGADDAR